MQALAVQAGQVQQDCGLDIAPKEYCKEVLKFGLLEVRRYRKEASKFYGAGLLGPLSNPHI